MNNLNLIVFSIGTIVIFLIIFGTYFMSKNLNEKWAPSRLGTETIKRPKYNPGPREYTLGSQVMPPMTS
jgi:heme/copper-type cytochrome/quinol oxidase subunit 3